MDAVWGALNLTVRLLSFSLVETFAPAAVGGRTRPASTAAWFSAS